MLTNHLFNATLDERGKFYLIKDLDYDLMLENIDLFIDNLFGFVPEYELEKDINDDTLIYFKDLPNTYFISCKTLHSCYVAGVPTNISYGFDLNEAIKLLSNKMN